MVGAAAIALVAPFEEARAGAIYDMDMFLNQGHPFDSPPVQTAPAYTAPAVTTIQPSVPAYSSSGAGATSAGGSTVSSAANVEMASTDGGSRFGERSDGNAGLYGISELRTGILYHDEGPFSRNKEDGPDVNVEMLFVSPDFLDVIWSPRPHIGADINTDDDTSSYYLGLSWEWYLWRNLFAGFSLGGAYHDGETEEVGRSDKKELGCSVLFRESVEMGWVFAERHTLSFMLDHISNARLCDENEGLENFGLRYGYRL